MQIYVGNLAYSTTEQELRQVFEGYGTVHRVHLPQDRETGRPRGFGFVDMPNATEANAAIQALNGVLLGGRTLSVNEARPREERRPRDDMDGRRPRW
jgi:RNA recognition motif-containing protein